MGQPTEKATQLRATIGKKFSQTKGRQTATDCKNLCNNGCLCSYRYDKLTGGRFVFCTLHAAAPLLLAACQNALTWLSDSGDEGDLERYHELRAAIATAQGG